MEIKDNQSVSNNKDDISVLEFVKNYVNNDYYDKCYNFDVKSEVNSIKQGFNEASNEFKDSFGEMNFNNIF